MGKFALEGKDLICPECGGKAKLVDSKKIYSSGSYGLSWVCERFPYCDTYVGCHKGTTTPLGTLANWKIRKARNRAHAALDPLWQEGDYDRGELYSELGIQMGKIPLHVGELTVEECEKLIKIIGEQYEV